MRLATKSFFVICLLTAVYVLFFNHRTPKILELKIDPGTGKLADPGMPLMRRFDSVYWVISDSRIVTFALQRKNSEDKNIFETNPEQAQAPVLGLQVAYFVKWFGGTWDYSINWTDRAGNLIHYDPKIAVKPIISGKDFLYFLGLFLISLTALFFYGKRQKASD